MNLRRAVTVLAFLTGAIAIVGLGIFWRQSHRPAPGPSGTESRVRPAAVAGAFYPADRAELARTVERYLAEANPQTTGGRVVGLIVPHAGYEFSGQVAAEAFKKVAGQEFDTVVLLGVSHHEQFPGAAFYDGDYFETPLGQVAIDRELAGQIMAADPRFVFRSSPHAPEHSLEVELPFLQKTLTNFRIVPILLGSQDPELAEKLGQTIARVATGRVLVVASTDLAHYPAPRDAERIDHQTIQAVLTGQADQLTEALVQLGRLNAPGVVTFMCGEGAVRALLAYAQAIPATQFDLLKYAHTGMVTGQKERVVGYAAISLSTTRKEELTEKEQKMLLQIARRSVEAYVRTGKPYRLSIAELEIDRRAGAFVTIKKNGILRGCIGTFEPAPLAQVVAQMALAAATEDRRFSPISPEELKDLEYEVSVLSVPQPVASADAIQLGKHGVQITQGNRAGVFLPQVVAETGWDKETFLSELCAQKAGLPRDCWQDPRTRLEVFTAQVFKEASSE
ncbi:MAG: AmmeMemoRadiSam system protein B [Candidatus Liptonbacteria bacterium]|nr:AmmeMemoRadiSam system protein B [Candidatus Liptonbacteria bacterium]